MNDLFSEDVSFRGLFLCTNSPPPLRQLIRIETVLPPRNVPFATHGMVVHVVSPGDPAGRRAGFGVQFYGMGDERRAWEAYVQYVQQSAIALPDHRDSRPPPSRTTNRFAVGSSLQDSRRFQRSPIVLEVRPRDLEDLYRLYSRDVSVGGMFLATSRTVALGSDVRLDVRHPHNGSVFQLTALVRRASDEPPGIGVEFTGLDERRRREFFEFIHAPIQSQDLDDELEVAESD